MGNSVLTSNVYDNNNIKEGGMNKAIQQQKFYIMLKLNRY